MNDLPEEYDVYPKGIAIAKDRLSDRGFGPIPLGEQGA